MFDHILRDLQYALRSFRRAPLTALTIVSTVSVGLGVVAVLFTILNLFLFRVDDVPGVGEMYRVERTQSADDNQQVFTRPAFDALKAETSVFADAYASLSDIDVRVDGRTLSVVLVTSNFLDVLHVQPVMGRGFTPADNTGTGNAVIVLSDKGWERRFNRDPHVLGKTVLIGGAPFEIIGVMPAGFRGLEITAPDCWGPLAQVGHFRPANVGRENQMGIEIIGRLKAGIELPAAIAQLGAWDSNQPAATPARPGNTLTLTPRRGTLPQPTVALMVFAPLFVAFGLILLIGCANVANLLLARGVARQREIGIRLSMGASSRDIVRQFMTENLLLALVAAAGGYVVSRVALQAAVYFALQSMPVDLGDINMTVPAADWRVALFMVGSAIAATALFALLPALRATRIDPVRTLRGELIKEARPGRARNVLIAVQVFASALLLTSAAIFLRSSMASSQFDPGFRTADTMMIQMSNEARRAAVLQQVAAEPAITSYAAVRPEMLDQFWGMAEGADGKVPAGYKFVSGAYFDVMGIPILRGRAFTPAERDEHPVVILSDSMARTLFPNRDAIGQALRLGPDPTVPTPDNDPPLVPRTVTVVGISRDVAGWRFTDVKPAQIFLPTSVDVPHTHVMARVVGDPDRARQTILDHLSRFDPNMGMIVTMRTVSRLDRYFLNIAFWVALVLGSLALLLTVSGLFSVLSYLVEQRTKEIGIRMALGAPSRSVARLMLLQTARPVAYGLAAGAGLVAVLAAVVLSTPIGALIGEIVHVTDPVAYAGSLAVILAACVCAAGIPAIRASRLDPMRTLRQD